ncbi:MAG: DNA replication and repair protein RecF [Thermonemataceae bacterium]|nr:DNA replication and repair protein RecF [Thermonemataceae bacterium]
MPPIPLFIRYLHLTNFKNYTNISIHLEKSRTIITGYNGVGKTNLLDAIYYLSFTRSAFQQDKQLIKHGENFFRIEANFSKEGQHLLAEATLTDTKHFSINKYHYNTLAEYLGSFFVILLAPNDTDLIRGLSEERRSFFDSIFCQIDKDYLKNLSAYKKLIKQRNATLKLFKQKNNINYTLIEVYDEQIFPLIERIWQKRLYFMRILQDLLIKYYKEIVQKEEIIGLRYQSFCSENDDIGKIFKDNFLKDCFLERTTQGVHKDDYEFLLNTYPIKKFGSQGQQKTFVIALKLAIFELICLHTNTKPILLLDDILDKLDEQRSVQLLSLVQKEPFGQVILTEANSQRAEQINQNQEWQVIKL